MVFSQALQEYDVESQRKQMRSLPLIDNICLSGHTIQPPHLTGYRNADKGLLSTSTISVSTRTQRSQTDAVL